MNVASIARLALFAMLGLTAGCVTPSTEVIVVFDSDAPGDRRLTVHVDVRRVEGGGRDGGMRMWTRGAEAGTIQLPASFAIVPAPEDPRDVLVDLVIDATLESSLDAIPDSHFRRTARFRFTPNATTRLPIFLAASCGTVAIGCTSSTEECTISQLCEEAGLTCGDNGACVPIDVLPATDAGFPDRTSVDATDVVTMDSSVDDATADAPPCPPGQMLCNDVCTDTQSGANNCGRCGFACPSVANANASCVAGVCVPVCDRGFDDCDRNYSTGCEVPIDDATNCGTCGARCAGSTPVCAPATADASLAGWACSTGCAASATRCGSSCVSTATDPVNCGACAHACTVPANAARTCAASVCGFACRMGYGDCDLIAMNGCESNLSTAAANCGACGRVCPTGGRCTAGVCACPTGQTACSGRCVDTHLDSNNCGSCGNMCANGTCAYDGTCNSNQAYLNSVVSRINALRSASCSLVVDVHLQSAAQQQAWEMAHYNFAGADAHDGSSLSHQVFSVHGYTGTAVDEREVLGASTPAAAVNYWNGSTFGRAALLDCAHHSIGVGYYYDARDSGNVELRYSTPYTRNQGPYYHYWVVDLGH